MSIDWSKAPAHATHWCPGNARIEEGWIYKAGQEFYSCYAEKSCEHIPNFPAWRALRLIPRPVEPAPWNGEGLPPVGTVCEFDGEPVTIITHVHQPDADDDEYRVLAVGQKPNQGQIVIGAAKYFRPLRTPEQIAEESREAKAKELFQFINPESKWHKCDHEVWLAAIDAGWQKVAK